MILVGCCPGGTASNVMTYLSKGDAALQRCLHQRYRYCTAGHAFPRLVLRQPGICRVDAMSMFISIVKVILVPLALGFVLQKLVPGVVKAAVPMLPLVSVVGIVLIVAAVVAVNKAAIAQSGLLIFAVVVLHNCCGLLLGYFAARFAGFRLPSARQSASRSACRTAGWGCARQCAFLAALPRCRAPSSASGTIFPVRWSPSVMRA
ncbi:hypothetical protein VXQ18_04095 [Brucella abortus]|nr:hypothetical protein [Brucella abortus]